MKKNTMMRIASVLLVVVLLTTSVISGTFAKYVTEKTGTDTARVAKWGVEIIANGNAFGHFYDSVDGQLEYVYDAATDSVASSNGEKLIAPGTNGEVVAMSITGTPEVDVEVKYESTVDLTGWTLEDSSEYCPIIFTVGTQTYGTNDTAATNKSANVAALITAVKGAIDGYTATYKANTNLNDTAIVEVPDVSWEWPFSTSDANDVKDTYLGDKAADDNAPEISISIKTTVTQID